MKPIKRELKDHIEDLYEELKEFTNPLVTTKIAPNTFLNGKFTAYNRIAKRLKEILDL